MGTSADKILSGPAKPTTAVGKAREDLRAGFITQKEFKEITSTKPEFQTEVGKLIGDRQIAANLFGADDPRTKQLDGMIKDAKKGKAPKLSDIAGIRKEHRKASENFIILQESEEKIRQGAVLDSPVGDVGMMFNVMRMFDPTSVVRESEFRVIQDTTGLPGKMQRYAQQIGNGQRLTPAQRQDMINTASSMLEAQRNSQKGIDRQFIELAERNNIDPKDVAFNFDNSKPELFVDPDQIDAAIETVPTITLGGNQVEVGTEVQTSRGPGILQPDGSVILTNGGQ